MKNNKNYSSACLRHQTTQDLIEELQRREDIETVDFQKSCKNIMLKFNNLLDKFRRLK